MRLVNAGRVAIPVIGSHGGDRSRRDNRQDAEEQTDQLHENLFFAARRCTRRFRADGLNPVGGKSGTLEGKKKGRG
jgi:hypothetical protein